MGRKIDLRDSKGAIVEPKELMEKFEGGAQIIGLRGIGGVGKTALAYKLAEALRDGFPDGQSW